MKPHDPFIGPKKYFDLCPPDCDHDTDHEELHEVSAQHADLITEISTQLQKLPPLSLKP